MLMETIQNKLIVLCAPSASGKTSIYKRLLQALPILSFSISATNREPRPNEKEGVDYYFLSTEDFLKKRDDGLFVEWEEVYPGKFYGTLKSEIERINNLGEVPILDVDVKGAQSIGDKYGDNALLIFIKAPSIEEIKIRLEARGTETPESLKKRLDRVPEELTYEQKCDKTVINSDLDKAVEECEKIVRKFLALAA